ncbi:MAG: acyl-CoA dehydrogenase family protein [Acidimicrobiia bacterium]|nr:acyl-CoA dehydrogenase family protein [Acidimicrobiia bacterium]
MALADIEVGLDEQELALRDTAHRFAEEVMRPAGEALDKLPDPAQVIAPDSVLWPVFAKAAEVGIGDALGPDPEADPHQRGRLGSIVYEELGWGDSGLAISLGCAGFHRTFALMSGDAELVDRFAGPDNQDIGCWAITEPDHGSDSLAFTQPHFRDGAVRANCIARADGDDFVISGQKSAWVSNGTIATAAVLFCTIDSDKGFGHGGVALVPLDLPGVSKGKPLDKLGQRALNQGEIMFDDVRIPGSHMIVRPELYELVLEGILTMANQAMGSIFTGVARAAFELALDYAKNRVQGGKPIIEHQSVQSRLFKMFSQVEAARSLARRVAAFNAGPTPMVQYSIASKVFCTNTAFQVASDALQIFGGNGLTREYPIEKLLRDARASMIEDGCNEVLGLVAATRLAS